MLSALLNSGTQGEHLDSQFLWETARFLVICLSPINPINVPSGVRGLRCCGQKGCAPCEKNGDLKLMQVNALKCVTRMASRGDAVPSN